MRSLTTSFQTYGELESLNMIICPVMGRVQSSEDTVLQPSGKGKKALWKNVRSK